MLDRLVEMVGANIHRVPEVVAAVCILHNLLHWWITVILFGMPMRSGDAKSSTLPIVCRTIALETLVVIAVSLK